MPQLPSSPFGKLSAPYAAAGLLCGAALLSLPGGDQREMIRAPTAHSTLGPIASLPPLTPAASPGRAALPGPYRAHVVRVVDGDTFEAVVRVWFGQDVTTLVRIRNVDAPELKAQCPGEARLAQSAREALGDVLASGAVSLHDLGLDKYGGRIVASVSVAHRAQPAEDVGAMLVAGGYARAYDGRKRASWCATLG